MSEEQTNKHSILINTKHRREPSLQTSRPSKNPFELKFLLGIHCLKMHLASSKYCNVYFYLTASIASIRTLGLGNYKETDEHKLEETVWKALLLLEYFFLCFQHEKLHLHRKKRNERPTLSSKGVERMEISKA